MWIGAAKHIIRVRISMFDNETIYLPTHLHIWLTNTKIWQWATNTNPDVTSIYIINNFYDICTKRNEFS